MSGAGGEQSADGIERGADLSRIMAFSDGVFAIAITLLVLQIEVPSGVSSSSDLWRGITDESGDFTAYGISFAVIGLYWLHHHRFMNTLNGFDSRLMVLNLAFLAFIVLIPFFSQVLGEYEEFPISVVLYAANLVLLSAVQFLIYRHVGVADLVKPQHTAMTKQSRGTAIYNGSVFLISIPLAFIFGNYAPLVWILLAFDPNEIRARRQKAG